MHSRIAIAALGMAAQLAFASPTPMPSPEPPPPPGTGTYFDPYHPNRCVNAQGQTIDCHQGAAASLDSIKLVFDVVAEKARQLLWYDPIGVRGYTISTSGGSVVQVHTPKDPNPVPYDRFNPFNHNPGDVVMLGLYFGSVDDLGTWDPYNNFYFGWDAEWFLSSSEFSVFVVSATLNSDYLPEYGSLCLGCVSLPEVFKLGLAFDVTSSAPELRQSAVLSNSTAVPSDGSLVMTWTPIPFGNQAPEPGGTTLVLAALAAGAAARLARRRLICTRQMAQA